MKHPLTLALVLTLGAASVNAQQGQPIPVWIIDSGTNAPTQTILQPGAATGEAIFAGHSSLGPFTYRELQASAPVPMPSATCGGALLNFPIVTGAGVFRFQDGSLLTVKIKEGSSCVDLAAGNAKVTLTYQITGGTGVFKNASGTLTVTGISNPVLFDAMMSPVFFAVSSEGTGTIVLSNN
jgi:hypothetical protein